MPNQNDFVERRKFPRLEEKKHQPIELKIEGSIISTDWWTPEIKEIFCEMCDEKDKCATCMNNNPWCG